MEVRERTLAISKGGYHMNATASCAIYVPADTRAEGILYLGLILDHFTRMPRRHTAPYVNHTSQTCSFLVAMSVAC